MKKKEFGFMFSVVFIIAMVTMKFWLKQRFELQLLELLLLIGFSWTLKFFLFKKLKKKDDSEDEK